MRSAAWAINPAPFPASHSLPPPIAQIPNNPEFSFIATLTLIEPYKYNPKYQALTRISKRQILNSTFPTPTSTI